MEPSHILSKASKGLLTAQFYQQAKILGRHPVSQQVAVHQSQRVRPARPLVAPDISQGLRETHEIRGALRVFIETCQRWKLSTEDQVVLLGYPSGDSVGMQVLNGRLRIRSQDIKDRSGYVIAISIGLGILYGENIDAENNWLRTPREILDGRAPLDYMLGGHMIDLITINRMVERERGL